MDRILIVSLHDVHPGSLEVVRQQVTDLTQAGVGVFSLLVVPEFHHGVPTLEDGKTRAFLMERYEQGDDLVVHGFYHDRRGLPKGGWFWTRVYSNDEAEFHAIAEEPARQRLARGRSLWKEAGWRVNGFIAPGWLMPEFVEGLLREMGFGYTVRLRRVIRLCDGEVTESQSLCYSTRSWWRIPVSLVWNEWLFGQLAGGRLLRLGLHPGDWSEPRVRRQALGLVRRALDLGYRPLTYRDYVAL